MSSVTEPVGRETPDTDAEVKDIFILGYSALQRALIERMPVTGRVRVHQFLHHDVFRGVTELPADRLVEQAETRLRGCPQKPDGILSVLDFPATEIMGLFNDRLGLHGPGLRSVLACNHKYWSRQLQEQAAPEAVPPYTAFDPFDPQAFDRLGLELPVWIKPFNAYCSHLGFRVESRENFEAGAAVMRERLAKLGRPLEYFLERAEVPDEIRALGGMHALAEGIIQGDQCTLEGYVFEGEPEIYGVVDSINEPNGSSFARYEYPSQLPDHVRERMSDIARRVMRHIGYDNGTFNIEFYHDPETDRIRLLELNPRFSQSHFLLFDKVDGISSQRIGFDIVIGKRPDPPRRMGPHAVAGKFFVRAYESGQVTRVPNVEQIDLLRESFPGLMVEPLVRVGDQLAEMEDQDSYSYELAYVWMGADSRSQLVNDWDKVRKALSFKVDGKLVT